MMKKFSKRSKAEYNYLRQRIKENPNVKFAVVLDDCGIFKKRQTYEIYDRGFDWYRLKNDGKLVYLHESLVDDDPLSFLLNEPEPEPEDEYDEEFFEEGLIF